MPSTYCVQCAQLSCDLFAIAKFLVALCSTCDGAGAGICYNVLHV